MKPPIVMPFNQSMDGYSDNAVTPEYVVEPLVLGSPFHVDCDENGNIFGKSLKDSSTPVSTVEATAVRTTFNGSISPLRIKKYPEPSLSVNADDVQPNSTSTLLASKANADLYSPAPSIEAHIGSTTNSDFELTPIPKRMETPVAIGDEAQNTSIKTEASSSEPQTPRSPPRSWEGYETSEVHRSPNILSLNSPPSLSSSLRSSDLDPATMMQRMRRKHNCIRELYNTEWQFAQDMAVVVRIYICASASVGFSVREIDTLFTNISEIMDVSLCTVAILEANLPLQILHGEGTLGEQDVLADRDVRIGKAMCIALTGQFYEVYEYYIHRNKEQMELLESLIKQMKETLNMTSSVASSAHTRKGSDSENSFKLGSINAPLRLSWDNSVSTQLFGGKHSSKRSNQQSEKPKPKKSKADMRKMKEWLDRCKVRASKFTTAWALDCLLIKPIQRLGKYPLFLKTILECSSPDDPDYDELQRALKRSKHYLDCVNIRYGEVEH